MTYSTSNPPTLFGQAIAGRRIWLYASTDDAATIDASGYITNAGELGMKVGDVVLATDTDDTNSLLSGHTVVTVSSTPPGAANLSNGVTLGGGSNTD